MQTFFDDSKLIKFILNMKKSLLAALVLAIIALTGNKTLAQCADGITPTGQPCGGTVQTAVPFLRINPDARSGAMGDVGIAISPDANAMHFNASKLAMANQNFGASLTYTPWLRNLGVNDIYLAYGTGYYQFGGKVKQAVGLGIRYFSLGSINWTDINGQPLGEGSPREFEIAGSYARQLSADFAIGATGKYIYSNLATGQDAGSGTPITSGQAFGFDLSATYKKKLNMSGGKSDLTIGGALTNMGNKIIYLRTADFIPTNLGIGAAWDIPLDQYNSIVVAMDLNKLMVPTPRPNDSTDVNQNKVVDWREKNLVKGMFGSFSDAPGGAGEEFKEINWSIGLEYWYDKQFAVRAGYFREDKSKGGRQYFTIGLGLKYNVMGINLSYLVPTSSQRGPLDNTLRFSLLFDAASFQDNEEN